jgi:hypothetical protein
MHNQQKYLNSLVIQAVTAKLMKQLEAFENKYAGYDNSGNAIVIPPSHLI